MRVLLIAGVLMLLPCGARGQIPSSIAIDLGCGPQPQEKRVLENASQELQPGTDFLQFAIARAVCLDELFRNNGGFALPKKPAESGSM